MSQNSLIRAGGVVVVLAAGAVALSTIHTGKVTTTGRGTSAATVASAPTYVAYGGAGGDVPATLAAAFSDLRRAATRQDEMPANAAMSVEAVGSLPGHQYGLNLAHARRIGAPGGTPVWLVPGATGSCITLNQGGGGCGPNSDVETRGLINAQVPVNGDPAVVYGILPDGASITSTDAHGQSHSVAMTGRAFALSATTSTGFTIKQADGHDDTNGMPGGMPPPAP